MADAGAILWDHTYDEPMVSSIQIHSENISFVSAVIRISVPLYSSSVGLFIVLLALKNKIGLVEIIGTGIFDISVSLLVSDADKRNIDDNIGVVDGCVFVTISFED